MHWVNITMLLLIVSLNLHEKNGPLSRLHWNDPRALENNFKVASFPLMTTKPFSNIAGRARQILKIIKIILTAKSAYLDIQS